MAHLERELAELRMRHPLPRIIRAAALVEWFPELSAREWKKLVALGVLASHLVDGARARMVESVDVVELLIGARAVRSAPDLMRLVERVKGHQGAPRKQHPRAQIARRSRSQVK